MSMIISAGNHLSGTHQGVQTAAPERAEQKGGVPEVGKTERSSESASLDQANMGEDGIAVTEVRRQQGAEQTNPQKQSAPPRMDRVEISEEGRAASAKLQRQTESADTEGDQYEQEDLSQYTDTELKLMYYNGDITLQEYEDETGETL